MNCTIYDYMYLQFNKNSYNCEEECLNCNKKGFLKKNIYLLNLPNNFFFYFNYEDNNDNSEILDFKIDYLLTTNKLKKYKILDETVNEEICYDLKIIIKLNISFFNHYENIIYYKKGNKWIEITKKINKEVLIDKVNLIKNPIILLYEKQQNNQKLIKNYKSILKSRTKINSEFFLIPNFYLYQKVYLNTKYNLDIFNYYKNFMLIPNYKDIFYIQNKESEIFNKEDFDSTKIPKKYRNFLIEKCNDKYTINKMIINSNDLPYEICEHLIENFSIDFKSNEIFKLNPFKYNTDLHNFIRYEFKRKVLEKKLISILNEKESIENSKFYLIEIEFLNKWNFFLHNCNEDDKFMKKTFFSDFSPPIKINNSNLLIDGELNTNIEYDKDFLMVTEEKMRFFIHNYEIDFVLKYYDNDNIQILEVNDSLKKDENFKIINENEKIIVNKLKNLNKNKIIDDNEIQELFKENKKLNNDGNFLNIEEIEEVNNKVKTNLNQTLLNIRKQTENNAEEEVFDNNNKILEDKDLSDISEDNNLEDLKSNNNFNI